MPYLAEMTTTDATDLEGVVALVPTGSTEQHGPALPLGTDSLVASDLAGALAHRADVVVTPTIPVGVSPHHRHFSGTLWVDDTTFARYTEEVARSLAHHGIRRLVFVNGHGGNVPALRRVGQRLRSDATAYAPTWNWWEAAGDFIDDTFDAPGGHAGHTETSMVLAVDDSLVHRDRLEAAERDAPPGWGRRVHGADVGFDTIDFTPTGAVGHPTQGDDAIGARIREVALDELAALADHLLDQTADDLFEHAVPLHPPRD